MDNDAEFLTQLLAVAIIAPVALFGVRRLRDRLRFQKRMVQRDAERLKPLSPPQMVSSLSPLSREDGHAA